MYLFRIFYSFLPLRNPIGFGASDLIILGIAILMVSLLVVKAWVAPWARQIADKPGLCMASLFGSAIVLRVALLPSSPVPTPSGADDFGYLLLGDTLAHLRMANPAHPLHQFFEAVFILQQPTHASIYPLGQGFVLAAGQLFGNPWIGVLLCSGIFSALCYWMLRAWVDPVWALAGGMLSVIQFGPLNPWLNSYWGGYVSAIAGCLVFGALPRLRSSPRLREGFLLGAGLGLQMLSRPFEAVFLIFAVGIYAVVSFRGSWVLLKRPLCGSSLLVFAAIALILMQNRSVTKEWTTMPYVLSRYQYGVPATFTFQPNAIPHSALTAEQDLDYQAQSAAHGDGVDSVPKYLDRLGYRIRYLRFFLLPPLFIAGLVFLPSIRQRRYLWAMGTVTLFLLGTNFYPYFYPHYVAALTCLFLLFSVRGLELMPGLTRSLLASVCFAAFLFWFGIYVSGNQDLLDLNRYQTWNYLNSGDPQGRSEVERQLATASGSQLVFVRYSPLHRFQEWIHNDANIDSSKTVWANDLGAERDQELIRYYPDRSAWLLEPDAHPPALTPYPKDAGAFLTVH